MIDTHSMMSGYHVLQGSLLYHIPMFIAMVTFIEMPDQEVLDLAFPGKGHWGIKWYWIALGLHVALALLQFAVILEAAFQGIFKNCGGLIQVLSTVGTIFQIFNLCTMLHLYSINMIKGEGLSTRYANLGQESVKR